MEMELITSFINAEALILIPTVYIIGMFLKSMDTLSDRFIPILLLIISMFLAIVMNGYNIDSIISGILSAGVAVFFNQVYKQMWLK